jgi:ABC-type phosphate/phosphonate transport system substrate-binding protein
MLRVIEETGDWPQGTLTSQFTSRVDECRRLLREEDPPFAILSVGLYLEHKDKHHLVPVAQPNINGKTTETYRIVVKKGKYRSLEDLRGKALGGSLLTEPLFLRKIVFRNELDPQEYFELKNSRRPLRALRELSKGELDAVMVNQQQYESLDSLTFAKELDPVFSSEPFPLAGLVANSKRTSRDERDRLTRSLSAMCAHAKGKDLCRLFGVADFVPADDGAYDQVMKLWEVQ